MRISKWLISSFGLATLSILSSSVAAQSHSPTMKAVVAHQYGGPEVLKLEDVPRPEPKENEVLVRVIASGVNPADPLIVSGGYAKEFGTHLPLVPGYDVAGIVEKTGTNINKLKVGDSVYGYVLWGGGWAEYAVATEGEAAIKPKSLTYIYRECIGAAGGADGVAGFDRRREVERGSDGSYSWGLGRRGKHGDPDRQGAGR